MDVADYRVCNCAGCRKTLLGESMRQVFADTPPRGWTYVAGRALGRPYCLACLRARTPAPTRKGATR